MAQAPDGAIYAATGHRGRLYKIEGPAKSTLLWTAPEPEIFALAVDRSGCGLRRHFAQRESLPH